MNAARKKVQEAVCALLQQVPHDVPTGVENALQLLLEVDVSVLPADVREEFWWVIGHPLHSPADANEIAERIAYLAHALNVDDDDASTEPPGRTEDY
jgi:hypothetical protein